MYNVNINFLKYSGIVKSILDWKKKINLVNIETRMPNPIVPASIKVYLKNKKGAQDMYRLLRKTKDTPTGKISWNKKYSLTDNEWNKIYRTIQDYKRYCHSVVSNKD